MADFVESSLDFSPAIAGSATRIKFSFAADSRIEQSEILTLSLSGFKRVSGSGILKLNGDSSSFFQFESNFYDNCSALLFLTALSGVDKLTKVSLIIPDSEGLTSPLTGVRFLVPGTARYISKQNRDSSESFSPVMVVCRVRSLEGKPTY